jgi:O-antigen ligase
MAIHGILQIQTGKGFGGLPPLDRNSDGSLYQIVAFGIFNDPNDLCLVFIAGIPFLYAEFRTASQFIFKLLALMLVPLFTYAAWLTNSRGGVLGILGMMGAHAIVSTHGIRRWIFSAIGVVTIMIFAPSRFSGGFSRETDRLILWGDGINLFQRYPLFGTGYNTFPDYSSTYQVAHNSYIQILAETGILGYFFYIFLIFITIIQLRRASNLKKEALVATDRAYLGACFSSLVGYLTSCYFLSRQYNAVFYVLFALTTCRILITCRDSQLSQRIVGLWKRDLKYGTLFSLVSIPGLWIIVRFGNTTLR